MSAHLCPLYLLCQIPSATWTSPSSTWSWIASSTWRTSPPLGTWHFSSRPKAGRTLRRSPKAQCYDPYSFLLTQHHHRCTADPTLGLQPGQLLSWFDLICPQSRKNRHVKTRASAQAAFHFHNLHCAVAVGGCFTIFFFMFSICFALFDSHAILPLTPQRRLSG